MLVGGGCGSIHVSCKLINFVVTQSVVAEYLHHSRLLRVISLFLSLCHVNQNPLDFYEIVIRGVSRKFELCDEHLHQPDKIMYMYVYNECHECHEWRAFPHDN